MTIAAYVYLLVSTTIGAVALGLGFYLLIARTQPLLTVAAILMLGVWGIFSPLRGVLGEPIPLVVAEGTFYVGIILVLIASVRARRRAPARAGVPSE